MINVHQKGYTLLEVMIVISISAAMFTIVSITFGGKQEQVQFTQAVRDFDSKLNDIMNDVSVGYYESDSTVGCTASSSPREPVVDISPSNNSSLGSSDDCVSVGKVIQFSPDKTDADVSGLVSESEQIIRTYNMVGLREDDDGSSPVTLEEIKPRVIPLPSVLQLRYGLKVTNVAMDASGTITQPLGAVAVFSSLGRTVGNESSDTTENLKISAVRTTIPGMSTVDIVSPLNDLVDPSNPGIVNNSRVILCVSDAGENRRASITFGGNIRGTIIDFDAYDEVLCG